MKQNISVPPIIAPTVCMYELIARSVGDDEAYEAPFAAQYVILNFGVVTYPDGSYTVERRHNAGSAALCEYAFKCAELNLAKPCSLPYVETPVRQVSWSFAKKCLGPTDTPIASISLV